MIYTVQKIFPLVNLTVVISHIYKGTILLPSKIKYLPKLNFFPPDMTTETSLPRRLQAQTLPDATQPIGKIHPFNKMALTFEPLLGL